MRRAASWFSAIFLVAHVVACNSEKQAVVIGADVPVFAEAKASGEPVAKLALGTRIKVRSPSLGEKDWLTVRIEEKERFVEAKHVATYPVTGTTYYAAKSGKVGDDGALAPIDVIVGDAFPTVTPSNLPGTLALTRDGLIVAVVTPTELSTTAPALAEFKADLLQLVKSAPRSPAASEVARRASLRTDADDALKDLIALHKAAQDAAGVEEIWLKLQSHEAKPVTPAVGQDLYVGSPLALLRATAAENAALLNVLRVNARVRVLEVQRPRSRVAVLVPARPEEATAANSMEAPPDKPWVAAALAVDAAPTDVPAAKRVTDRLKADPGLIGWLDTALLRGTPVRVDATRREAAAAKSSGLASAALEALAVAAFLSPLDASITDEAYTAAVKAQRYDLGFAILQLRERMGPVFAGLTGAPTLGDDALQMGAVAYVDLCRGPFLWASLTSDADPEDGACHVIDRQVATSFAESDALALPEGDEEGTASTDPAPPTAAAAGPAKKSLSLDKSKRVRIRLRNTTPRYGALSEGLFVAGINLDAQCAGRPTAQVTTWRVPVPALGPYEVLDLWVTASHPLRLTGSAAVLAATDAEARSTVQSAVAAAESANDIGGAWGMGFVGDLPECQEEYAEPEDN